MSMHDAETLHKFSNSTCKGVREVLADVKGKFTWNKNETILDVGCGTGNVTVNVLTELAPDDATIIATDIADEMINFAKSLYTHPRITFKKLDILDDNLWTSWNKEQFSKIFCFYVMQRIKDDRKAYENMYNLLKPGSEALILFPIEHTLDEIVPYLAKMPKYSNYTEEFSNMHFHIAPRDDHVPYNIDLLKTIGFDIILCKPKIIVYPMRSIDDFVELFGLASRVSQVLPKDLFEEALEDSKQIVRENKILEEAKDGFSVKYTALVVMIKKPY